MSFDQNDFDQKITELIRSGQETEAESRLLSARAELTSRNDLEQLEYLLNRLGQFYSMPGKEDPAKAEECFLEREALSSKLYPRLQTATFYFYVLSDFEKTIRKVDEIGELRETAESPSYYSALALKGQALVKLGRVEDTSHLLDELLKLIGRNSPKLPYGDELNFLDAALSNKMLVSKIRDILNLLIPKIRSQEYREKAKMLLEST